ncbi:unnamed protein product [Laminaria digitata]
MGILAAAARSQEVQNCSVGTSPLNVSSTEEAATLAASLECSNGDFYVQWVGEVFVNETIHVGFGTSLNITGAGPGATADGRNMTQLFYVEGGSRLHLSDMILAHGSASGGGALYAKQSSVSFSGNTSFSSNSAGYGGAIFASESTVSWDGDDTHFSSNSAGYSGGAIFAPESTVSWDGDGTQFSSNSAEWGGAICAPGSSTVSWDGDGTQFSSNSAEWGGAIFALDRSTVSWVGDRTQFSSNSAGYSGGAIYSHNSSTVSWDGDGTQFSSNSAGSSGGAIFALDRSTVSWDGDGTQFSSNSAEDEGGAIFALDRSTVSWDGDGTQFSSNSADSSGGTIFALDRSTVSWDGDGTQFSSNSAGEWGGAIYALGRSTVSWDGDGTQFSSNSAGYSGGAIAVLFDSTVSWDGDGTQLSSNSAGSSGGAIYSHNSSTVSWDGDGTQFSSNSAEADGGAISTWFSPIVSWGGTTTFESNVAGVNGGGLHSNGCDSTSESGSEGDTAGATFIDNSARYGGALYLSNCKNAFNFTEFTFEKNSAFDGGAVAAYESGSETQNLSVVFFKCTFSDNVASGSGGAVETLAGQQEFISCDFEGNSADVGGAMRLGGSAVIRECSFQSNLASTRGLAVAVVGWSAKISGSSFDGNDLSCAVGSYRNDTEKEGTTVRFETVCFDCPPWDECSDCNITRGTVTPECDAPLEHSSADTVGVSLETLSIDEGYWRATNESDSILACYNADACSGGQTGSDSYCAPGYKGPYCAVCEATYSSSLAHTCTRCSSSRRQGLMAATVIAAIVAIFAIVTIFRYMLSTEHEEGNFGCFHRRVVRAVPLQALKIIVVVWQILTQFADAANVTYPGVYQEFMNGIDVINFDLGSVLSAGCVWSDIDFHDRLLVSTLGPFVVVGLLAMTYWIATRRDSTVVEKIHRKHQTAFLLLTFLIYSSVSSTVFQTFACETLDDGVEYLRADYRIHCTDATHKTFEVYAGIMIAVYPLGIPLLYAVLLFRRRDVLAEACADKAVAQPIAGLWEPYRPERFYYEIVECGRRVMLTGVVVFIFPNDAAQIAITMLSTFVFLLFFEALSPYKSESDMWLSRGGHVIVFLSMYDVLLLKVDVSSERDQSQAVFAGVLVAGHVLMVLAIVVEVVGICYAAASPTRIPTFPRNP